MELNLKSINRVEPLDEGLHVLTMLWNKELLSITFKGRYFKLNGANIKIPHILIEKIPITVAAKKKKTMTIAAKYADIWESSYISPQEFLKLNNEFSHIIDKNINRKIERSIELDVIITESVTDLEYKEKNICNGKRTKYIASNTKTWTNRKTYYYRRTN